nr:unnamed protein product [Spirometra erinaceieuropaei]
MSATAPIPRSSQLTGSAHLVSNLRTGNVAVPTSQGSDLRFEHHSQPVNAILGETTWQSRTSNDETQNRLGHAQIIRLLKFCLKTYFTFDGTIYEQVKRTPMGSPISGLIAKAVLQRLESLLFRHHRPKFWTRYVDDTFVFIERDQVLIFKEHFNAVFLDIQFTMEEEEEEEENNQLAFLTLLLPTQGTLSTKAVLCLSTSTSPFRFFQNIMPPEPPKMPSFVGGDD